jgi:hypothetical protein
MPIRKSGVALSASAPGASQRPEFFRLPKPGVTDPYFGLSRSFYYLAEARGWLTLVRICEHGKRRGITLIEYSAVASMVRSQMEGGN